MVPNQGRTSRTRGNNTIQIIQGGQYGSEAKGLIAAHLAVKENVDIAVRTGATNAGHTVIYNGEPVKMQQLPVGWVNPNTTLVLGAGALIDPDILDAEVELVSRLTKSDVMDRLVIDPRAGVHLPYHRDRSTKSGRHVSMGATGKGCSEALIDKIRLRGTGYANFGAYNGTGQRDYRFIDTAEFLNSSFDRAAHIQLEGTQGTMLDLQFGSYPYVTHKQTLPGVWMSEAGLSPALPTDIVMVVRTWPIRVAGNSGPLPFETSWPMLARQVNESLPSPLVSEIALEAFEAAVASVSQSFKVPRGSDGNDQHGWSEAERVEFADALSNINKEALKALPEPVTAELAKFFELTTVTRKLRRIGRISHRKLKEAAMLVRPHRVAVTFMNYEFPEFWLNPPAPKQVRDDKFEYVKRIMDSCSAPVTHLSYGPASEHTIQVQ